MATPYGTIATVLVETNLVTETEMANNKSCCHSSQKCGCVMNGKAAEHLTLSIDISESSIWSTRDEC